MTTCRLCGADIEWATIDGRRIPLDVHGQIAGEGRYARRGNELVPVTATADVIAHTDHRTTCAYGQRRPV